VSYAVAQLREIALRIARRPRAMWHHWSSATRSCSRASGWQSTRHRAAHAASRRAGIGATDRRRCWRADLLALVTPPLARAPCAHAIPGQR
jgi:hypothetical protein